MSKKTNTGGKSQKKAATADGLELSAAHRRALNQAEQLRALKGKGAPRRRAKAAAIVRRVEAERDYQRTLREVAAGIDETVQLAEARKEDVVTEDVVQGAFARGEHGELVRIEGRPVLVTERVVRKRVRGRDGLQALFDDHKLSEWEHRIGMSVRYLVENAPARLGSCLEERTSSGPAASSDPFVKAALHRAYVGVMLTAVERAFAKREDGVAELRALQSIAGEGASLRSLGDGPNVREANLRRLRRALDVAEQAISAIRSVGGLRIRSG